MDQKERIEQLKAEVQRLGGDQAVMYGIDQLPPDVAEVFLERVIAIEKSEETEEDGVN
jgi:hypothetical protein